MTRIILALYGICGIFAPLTLSNLIYGFGEQLVYNCSCPTNPKYDCNELEEIKQDCSCSTINRTELNSKARFARQNGSVLWSSQNGTAKICCADSSTNEEATMLRLLLNFAYVSDLDLNGCHLLMSNNRVTMFGLERIMIHSSDVSAQYPDQKLIMNDTDLSGSTTEYKDFHVIHMHLGVVTGNDPMRAWSIIRKSANGTSNPLKRRGLDQKEDGRFMLTYIYA